MEKCLGSSRINRRGSLTGADGAADPGAVAAQIVTHGPEARAAGDGALAAAGCAGTGRQRPGIGHGRGRDVAGCQCWGMSLVASSLCVGQ